MFSADFFNFTSLGIIVGNQWRFSLLLLFFIICYVFLYKECVAILVRHLLDLPVNGLFFVAFF